MLNNRRLFGIENFLFLTTLLICGYYYINREDATFVMIFALLTLLASALEWTPIYSRLQKKEVFSTIVLNLKYSSFLFVGGILFSRVSTENILKDISIGQASAAVIIFGMITFLSFLYYLMVYMYKNEKIIAQRDKIIAENTKVLRRSNIKGFGELLTTIESKKGDILLVAGNLLSLKTEKGTSLLKDFLQQNPSNILKLVIPKSSRAHLKELKENIEENTFLNRIEVSIYEPFWFLQGIVIIGKSAGSGYSHAITPLGCYYYKIKFSEDEDIAEDGIYIDLSSQHLYDDYPQAVSAYYFLLNELKYSQEPFEVKKVFTEKNRPYNPKIEAVNWSHY